jgi:hypothetical protein
VTNENNGFIISAPDTSGSGTRLGRKAWHPPSPAASSEPGSRRGRGQERNQDSTWSQNHKNIFILFPSLPLITWPFRSECFFWQTYGEILLYQSFILSFEVYFKAANFWKDYTCCLPIMIQRWKVISTKESAHDLIYSSLLPTAIIAKRSPQTDNAKHWHFGIAMWINLNITNWYYLSNRYWVDLSVKRSLRWRFRSLNRNSDTLPLPPRETWNK